MSAESVPNPESTPTADVCRSRPVCLFLPSFGDGGVERMMTNIAHGIAEQGFTVDFVVGPPDAPYLDTLPASVRLHHLTERDRRARRRFLHDYVERERPAIVLTAKTDDDRVALAVKASQSGDTRYFLRPGTTQSERWNARGRNPLKRWWERRQLSALYRRADGVIAVSRGVAEDVAAITGLALDRIRVVRNPNITPELEQNAHAPLDHPWFAPGEPPVIMGVGGLRLQKDFTTLIRAFALVQRQRPCRLLILGQGRQRERLQRLAEELGVGGAVDLHGFDPNPYRFLARAGLFVLSSRWEGSPNVLTESLALGVPVVATDCRSGPREILQDGRYGPLVPVGDVEALARAMEQTLREPLAPEVLREAVNDYRLDVGARGYLDAFGLAR
ncbi:glycosyltransferase [Allochromatium tepidum]|uniref:Glycosyl transferase n=1 Tax=Allochromatium tepidum TaxID=553982 RepID=A0ABM7QPN0_9GAMM|nr:glycosyltransferase [Allochromatium tepidum]BCU08099.1 glycosyl transferase [Allochromatium tepidum]